MGTKNSLLSERLLGLPLYRQGHHDRLCVYYAAAMLVDTVAPELSHLHGQPPKVSSRGAKSGDILSNHYPSTRRLTTGDEKLAAWFFNGAQVKKAATAINAALEAVHEGTRVRHSAVQAAGLWETCRAAIGSGIPLVLGWQSEQIGDHAVLVRGWEKRGTASGRSSRWLLLHDPAGGREEISERQLRAMAGDLFDVITVDPATHGGLRPDKRLEDVDGWWIERWWPRDGQLAWTALGELWSEAAGAE